MPAANLQTMYHLGKQTSMLDMQQANRQQLWPLTTGGGQDLQQNANQPSSMPYGVIPLSSSLQPAEQELLNSHRISTIVPGTTIQHCSLPIFGVQPSATYPATPHPDMLSRAFPGVLQQQLHQGQEAQCTASYAVATSIDVVPNAEGQDGSSPDPLAAASSKLNDAAAKDGKRSNKQQGFAPGAAHGFTKAGVASRRYRWVNTVFLFSTACLVPALLGNSIYERDWRVLRSTLSAASCGAAATGLHTSVAVYRMAQQWVDQIPCHCFLTFEL